MHTTTRTNAILGDVLIASIWHNGDDTYTTICNGTVSMPKTCVLMSYVDAEEYVCHLVPQPCRQYIQFVPFI